MPALGRGARSAARHTAAGSLGGVRGERLAGVGGGPRAAGAPSLELRRLDAGDVARGSPGVACAERVRARQVAVAASCRRSAAGGGSAATRSDRARRVVKRADARRGGRAGAADHARARLRSAGADHAGRSAGRPAGQAPARDRHARRGAVRARDPGALAPARLDAPAARRARLAGRAGRTGGDARAVSGGDRAVSGDLRAAGLRHPHQPAQQGHEPGALLAVHRRALPRAGRLWRAATRARASVRAGRDRAEPRRAAQARR